MIRALLSGACAAALLLGTAEAQTLGGGSFAPPGTNGQTPYNNNGSFGAYSLTGDCSFAVTTGVLVCGAPYLEKQTFFTSTTGSAAINIPQGVTPTSPANGDLWITSAGVFAQIAGSTVGPFGVGGGSGCTVAGTAGQIVVNNGSTGCSSDSTLLQTPAASVSGLYTTKALFTGGTATTTFPLWYIDEGASKPTNFSTAGTIFGVNAASGFTGNFVHWTVNGSSTVAFAVSGSGVVTEGQVKSTQQTFTNGIGGAVIGIIASSAAGDIQLGSVDAAAPVAQTLSAQSVVAGTSNTAGAAMIIQGSRSTGTGAGGTITLSTGATGTTGTAQNAAQAVMQLDTNQHIKFASAAIPTVGSCGTGSPTVTAGSTDAAGEVTTGTTASTCTLSFKIAYTASPFCVVGDNTTRVNLLTSVISTTAITMTMTANSGDKVAWVCHGA